MNIINTINTGLDNNRNLAVIYTNPIEIRQTTSFADSCVGTGDFSELNRRFIDNSQSSSSDQNGYFLSNITESGNTDVVVTGAALTDDYISVDWISWSFSAIPTTAPSVIVEIGGTKVWEHDISGAGFDGVTFDPPLQADDKASDENLVVTLEAGGAAVTGKLKVRYH